ncbi:hypothetical protein ACKWTF_013021 [Chironomus riparius]
MDQTPSKSIDQRRTDQNNNKENLDKNSINSCSCTNISIMQLFHEMKQEYPKVPDHIVQQLVTENCHNRRACLEQLNKVTASSPVTPTMYPSKSIHSNSDKSNQQTLRSQVNGLKIGSSQKMKEMTEKFESTSISSSSSTSTSSNSKLKRPTTLPLRPAPDPPTFNSNNHQRTPSSTLSSPNSTTSVSSFSTTSQHQQLFEQAQTHHNVVLDSTASKINDSLNVQLNVKVSPISTKRPAPPPPPARQRFTSHLSVQPQPSYTNLLDQKNDIMQYGGATASTGTTGQRSYTNVKLTLRQPSASLQPIDIQAGPQTLSYSSSSFNAQQGCESHLKITVAGNGESCIQAVRTAKNVPDINQIDTTINIEGNYLMNDDMKSSQYRIVTNPYILHPIQQKQQQLALPQSNNRLTEDDLRQLIKRQIKQKELLECELDKEKEKLQMIRLDIITLTTPIMTQIELRELCDEITRLRTICGRISDEIDVVTSPQPSRAIMSASSPSVPPPIPKGLVSRKGHSPSNSLLPQIDNIIKFPASQPPSYHEAVTMRETERIPRRDVNSIDEKWTCTICTFQNHHLMDICETCEMPRVSGIKITSSSFRPMLENNQLQGATNDSNSNNSNEIQATAL